MLAFPSELAAQVPCLLQYKTRLRTSESASWAIGSGDSSPSADLAVQISDSHRFCLNFEMCHFGTFFCDFRGECAKNRGFGSA